MIKLFFDIETLPCAEENKEKLMAVVKMRAKKRGAAVPSDDQLFAGMSFDGTFGRIACIGYIKEDGGTERGVLSGNEKEILTKFWELAKDTDLFIGHNVLEFDFPFIYKRSVILGVKPRLDLNFARYRNSPIYDTMKEWERWSNNNVALNTLAVVLGFPSSKEDMDGSQVWPYFQQGRIKEICQYCLKDVELTRKVYYKMIFEVMPAEETVDKPEEEPVINTPATPPQTLPLSSDFTESFP